MKVKLVCDCGEDLTTCYDARLGMVLNDFVVKVDNKIENRLWSEAHNPLISYLICPKCGKKHPLFEVDSIEDLT